MFTRILSKVGRKTALASLLVIATVAFPAASTAQNALASHANAASATAAPPAVGTSHEVVLANLPQATTAQLSQKVNIPHLTPWSAAQYAQMKAAARTAPLAVAGHGAPLPAQPGTNGLQTPSASKNFAGLDQAAQGGVSGAGGLAPSDAGLACSSAYCLEAINSALAVYNSNGVLQSGYPKSLRAFDGATCASGTPIPFDTDAAFDGKHFIVISETSGPLVDGCSEVSGFYLAISTTNNPLTSVWHVYHFDLSQGNTVFCDFPKVGYNNGGVYWSCNNYASQGHGGFTNARVNGCNKATLVAGGGVSCPGFFVNQFSVQPAKILDNPAYGPVNNSELYISSNNGGGSGVNVSTFRGVPSGTVGFDTVGLGTSGYSIPPNADDNQNGGGCSACIDTGDNRIGSAVFARAGHLFVAFNSAVNNGTRVVAALFWVDVATFLNDAGAIQGSSFVYNQGTFFYNGAEDSYYPAAIPDSSNNINLAFNLSGNDRGPGSVYIGRRVTLAGGGFHDGGIYANSGAIAPAGRWGDYNAATTDGTNSWFEVEVGKSGTGWGTQITRDNFTANAN